MADTLGARLRQRREERQIRLTAIADQTKIKASLLEALERDDVSQWPSGIFRRAFIRAYAEAIGLDPDVTVREFLDAHPDPLEEFLAEPSAGPPRRSAEAGVTPPMRLRYVLGSAARDVLQRLGMAKEEIPQAPSAPNDPPLKPPVSMQPDLAAAARLCTDFGRVSQTGELAPLLSELSNIVNASGLVVWVWNPDVSALTAALTHGYSDRVLAHLPSVAPDDGNPTAAAFRAGRCCTVAGSDRSTGALVVPLMTPAGCVGVLAIEMLQGGERNDAVVALATIFAAQLATLVGSAGSAAQELSDRRLA